jgi:PAT family beta-lactamase induction signal transducer AmpG
LPGKFIGGFSGEVVYAFGYPVFFSYAALLGIPAILLVIYIRRHQQSGLPAKTAEADAPANH